MKQKKPAKKKSTPLSIVTVFFVLLLGIALLVTLNRLQNPEPTVSEPRAAENWFSSAQNTWPPLISYYMDLIEKMRSKMSGRDFRPMSSTNNKCFDNCFQSVKPGNGSYCRSICDVPPVTNRSCFDTCFPKTNGNGSACRIACDKNDACVTNCANSNGTQAYTSCVIQCASVSPTPGDGECSVDANCTNNKVCVNSTCVDVSQTHLACRSNTTQAGTKIKINDGNSAIAYEGPWASQESKGYKYHYAPAPLSGSTVTKNLGAKATYTFTGDQISVGSLSWSNRGYADILIDGVKATEFNMYDPGIKPIVWQSNTLSCGQHTISVQQSNLAGENGGRLILLDYLEYRTCATQSAFSCARVSGSGSNENGCTTKGAACAIN